MCDLFDPFGTKKASDRAAAISAQAAAEAKAAEEKRQADIAKGNTNIDTAFAQYNPDYFTNYKTSYTDTQNPQIDQQYKRAVDKLTAALAGRGQLDGTVGFAKMADAKEINDRSRIQAANEAENLAGDLKGRISDKKTSLYALNQAAADPLGATAQATGAATALAAPAATSPLGDLFASVLAPYSYFQQARMNSAPAPYRYNFASPGSGMVVR